MIRGFAREHWVAQRAAGAEPSAQRNLAAAWLRLENSRSPEDLRPVSASLIDWPPEPGQDSLRRAFVVWLEQTPAARPGAGTELPDVADLEEMHAMWAERVKTRTEMGPRPARRLSL
jgi:hypothetical protein